MAGGKPRADIVLVRSDQQGRPLEVVSPHRDPVTACQLHRYGQDARGRVEMTYRLSFVVGDRKTVVDVQELLRPMSAGESRVMKSGWHRDLTVSMSPESPVAWQLYVARPTPTTTLGTPTVTAWQAADRSDRPAKQQTWLKLPGQGERQFALLKKSTSKSKSRLVALRYACSLASTRLPLKPARLTEVKPEKLTTVPGFEAVRLPLSRSIMPTALCWRPDGTLAITSLKGHVYLAHDSDGDGLEDRLELFEEGLAAPYGILADGNDLLVCHKPEVLRLRDTDGDGRADVREVLGSGWGYSDDYHDWTCGLIRDKAGNLFVGLGSNYSQRNRVRETSRWRGKVLKISKDGRVEPVGHAFRYPTGLAIDARGRIFVSDNQGVQNTFNEINHLVAGRNYGVPSRFEEEHRRPPVSPAIQVPHPWSRSVNGLFFLPGSFGNPSLAGHGIGCEYDNRFLVRFTLQEVGGEFQGAVYHFSRPGAGAGGTNFVGPLSGAVSPAGDIYIGNIFDSGWLGGRNTGTITRLRPLENGPNGLRELAAVPGGFRLRFSSAVDRSVAARAASFTVSGYTRAWKGGYTTPDSSRHKVTVSSVVLSADGRTVTLAVAGLKAGHVYEVTCGKIGVGGAALWPATGHYSLHRLPERN